MKLESKLLKYHHLISLVLSHGEYIFLQVYLDLESSFKQETARYKARIFAFFHLTLFLNSTLFEWKPNQGIAHEYQPIIS